MIDELRGWKETTDMSDEVRRKLHLMGKAADEIERLRGIVAVAAVAVRGVAFEMEAPNEFTPRLVQLSQAMEAGCMPKTYNLGAIKYQEW